MNLVKSFEFFNPNNVEGTIHIIGCGSIGSTLAENLARLGLSKFNLYDFDMVESHNLTNQMFFNDDIGKLKVDATKDLLLRINPEARIKTFPNGWEEGTVLNGYVFLCVDNIETRRKICESNKHNPMIKAVFDFRTTLKTTQLFACQWDDVNGVANFIASMQFTHEEAKASTPRTACGLEMGVVSTIRAGVAFGVANFINLINQNGIKDFMEVMPFDYNIFTIN